MALFSRRDEDIERMSWSSKAMSEDDYHELERLSPDRKYEYINGKAYMMSGGSREHDLITNNIWAALRGKLRSGPCKASGTNVQVLLGKKLSGRPHYVYPDATVTCDATDLRYGNTLIEAPRVVVEVLSPSTETKDRGTKFKAYQHTSTIQEIVLVNQYYSSVEVWQRDAEHPENPNAWYYRHYGPGEVVELTSLNIQLAMGEIYEEMNFDIEEEADEGEGFDAEGD